jgi:hypothetical protein
VNVVNELAAIHRLLHQEQHVKINILREAQLRDTLKIKPKLLLGKFFVLTRRINVLWKYEASERFVNTVLLIRSDSF